MLTKHSALAKDKRNAKAPVLQHRHYAVIAGIVAKIDSAQRLDIAKHFANELADTNPKFDRDRFLRACNVIALRMPEKTEWVGDSEANVAKAFRERT